MQTTFFGDKYHFFDQKNIHSCYIFTPKIADFPPVSPKGPLQNHCSHNAKANSKDNSENALLCSLLRQSTDLFFSWLSKVTHSAIKTFNSKEVESGNGILQNHCSHNAKANSKDNSENALLCSLLRQSTDFFFVALQNNTLNYQNFQFKIS